MPTNLRPWFMWYDATGSRPFEFQGDDPVGGQFVPISVSNKRNQANATTSTSYLVGDLNMTSRGAKNILWSSEGYAPINGGTAVAALTGAQKGATSTSLLAPTLDLSPYRNLVLMLNYTSLTAGTTPTIQFELDYLDDTGTPNSYPIWKPTAFAAGVAAQWLVFIGNGNGVFQAAAAPNTAATGFTAASIPGSLNLVSLPLTVPPQGKLAWTVTSTPTSGSWQMLLYGMH